MNSIELTQDVGGLAFDSFADVADAVTTTGHSTRDAILGVVSQGINILPQLFGRNQQQQGQQLPPTQYVDPNAVGASLQLGAGNGGVNLGGGLQLNTTTLLMAALAAVVLLKK